MTEMGKDASYLPLVVVASSKDASSCEELARMILDVSKIPEAVCYPEDIKAYPWHIDTKYYTADVHVCCLARKTIVNKEFAENVQGVVIYVDSNKVDALSHAEQWLMFTKEFEAEIQILVCDKCSPDKNSGYLSKLDAQEWCLAHGFELVELDPTVLDDTDEEEEDDFPETIGVRRIIQALHSHMWPNLIMKETRNTMSRKLQEMLQAESCSNRLPEEGQISSSEPSHGPESNSACRGEEDGEEVEYRRFGENRSREETIDALIADVTQVDADASFEELFEQFRDMKMKAQSLPGGERKVYAEKVAMAFWKAIGGDESELAGLSSDEAEEEEEEEEQPSC